MVIGLSFVRLRLLSVLTVNKQCEWSMHEALISVT